MRIKWLPLIFSFAAALLFCGTVALSFAGTITLPQTGQKECYDASGGEITCTGTGQAGEKRYGTSWPSPRFTDNSDGTVTDNLTGLIWLKEANCIKTNYPAFDNDSTAADGMVTWQHALDFVAGINSGTYPDCGAGFTDWRLPQILELRSLVHEGYTGETCGSSPCGNNAAWLNTQGFTNAQSGVYWSSTTSAYDTVLKWYVIMDFGYVYNHSDTVSGYVLPVRAGQ